MFQNIWVFSKPPPWLLTPLTAEREEARHSIEEEIEPRVSTISGDNSWQKGGMWGCALPPTIFKHHEAAWTFPL